MFNMELYWHYSNTPFFWCQPFSANLSFFYQTLNTIYSLHSNLVKIHSKSPTVMGFCPVCLGILPYSWQNTSRNITCEQLRQILSACAASFKWRETLYVVSGFKVNVFFTFLWQITFSFNFSLIFMWAFYKLFCFFFPIFINFGWYKIFIFLQFC